MTDRRSNREALVIQRVISQKVAIMFIGSICLVGMVAMLLCPPWYWDGKEATYVSERALMAGYGWLWSPPPAPDDLEGWHPVVWWGRLSVQLFVAAALTALMTLGIVMWGWCTQPFRWPRRLDDSSRSPSN